MAIKAVKKLIEDLENDTSKMVGTVTKLTSQATYATTSAYAGTAAVATTSAYAGTAAVAAKGTSGSAL